MKLPRILLAAIALCIVFALGQRFPSSTAIIAHLQDDPAIMLDHPELMEGARRLAKSQREEKGRKNRVTVLASQETFLLESPLTTIATNSTSPPIDLIEYLDYQCEPCRSSYPVITRAQQQNPRLRVVYQMLPVFGSGSELAARMALAAQLQGKFGPFHQRIIKSERALNLSTLHGFAEEAGLDQEQLEADMFSDQVRNHIDRSKRLADELGVTGVPSFIVSGQLLSGGLTDDVLQSAMATANARTFATTLE